MKKKYSEMLKILKENKTLSYKKLSKITGYHEKSLIRINKMLNDKTYPIKKVTNEEKEYIINLYKNSEIKNIKDFYHTIYISYNKKSYSFVQKLIKPINEKNKIKNNYIIIGNFSDKSSFEKTYYAFDLKNNKLLFSEKSFEDTFSIYIKIVKYITEKFKRNDFMFKGNSFLKNKNSKNYINFITFLKKYNIFYNTNKIYLNKNIKFLIKQNLKNNSIIEDNIIKSIAKDKIIYSEIKRKVLMNNVVEYENSGYRIDSKIQIKKGTPVKILFYLFCDMPYIKIDNKIFELTKIYEKDSKKKYS